MGAQQSRGILFGKGHVVVLRLNLFYDLSHFCEGLAMVEADLFGYKFSKTRW